MWALSLWTFITGPPSPPSQRAATPPLQRVASAPANAANSVNANPVNATTQARSPSPRFVQHRRPEPTLAEQHVCATKIQAAYRGYTVCFIRNFSFSFFFSFFFFCLSFWFNLVKNWLLHLTVDCSIGVAHAIWANDFVIFIQIGNNEEIIYKIQSTIREPGDILTWNANIWPVDFKTRPSFIVTIGSP